jgi:putative tryptophan/tyrosine transport system substrate-binding protein
MKRREFVTLIGGVAASSATWPPAPRAQQPTPPVVGFLNGASAGSFAPMVDGFRRGLSAVGYVEGQNLALEFRWAENQPDRLPALAADLVRRRVSAIAATGGLRAVLAAKIATVDIPIVFTSGSDPIRLGIIASYNRPEGNATGVNMLITEIEAKRLGLLHELVPAATRIVVMVDPNNPDSDQELREVQAGARTIGAQLEILRVGSAGDIETAFATLVQAGAQALQVAASPLFVAERERIVMLAARHRVPAVYEASSYAAVGGLMSYGPSIPDVYRQVGVYVGQILKGAKPSDLPVIQPTAIELVINRKTANALGLEIPAMLLALADEVIE